MSVFVILIKILIGVILLALLGIYTLVALLMGSRKFKVSKGLIVLSALSALLGGLVLGYWGTLLGVAPLVINLLGKVIFSILERQSRGACLKMVWMKNVSVMKTLRQQVGFQGEKRFSQDLQRIEKIPNMLEILVPYHLAMFLSNKCVKFIMSRQGASLLKAQHLDQTQITPFIHMLAKVSNLKPNDKFEQAFPIGKVSATRF